MDVNAQLSQWLVVATVIGPVAGVGVGWLLTEMFSTRLQDRRARAQARFATVRGLMRDRTTSDLSAHLNEVPLHFGDDPEIMRLWRDLAQSRSADAGNTLVEMVIAMVRKVGIRHLEETDVRNYVAYTPPVGKGEG